MTKKKTKKPLNVRAWIEYSKRLAKWAEKVSAKDDSGGNPTPPPPPPPGHG